MIYDLKIDQKELRYIREAIEHEQDRLIDKQRLLDEDDDKFSEIGNDAMVYQSLIDRIDRILLE